MLVMLFHSKCSHCHDQMDDLADHLDAFGSVDLVFLTTEDTLPMQEMAGRWPCLATATNAMWGTVSAEDFDRDFGSRVTPGIYLFDSAGVLRHKTIGTVETSLLLTHLLDHQDDGSAVTRAPEPASLVDLFSDGPLLRAPGHAMAATGDAAV